MAAQRVEYVPRPLSPVEKANTEASEKQQKIIKDGIYTTPTPTPSEDSTWLEKAVSEVWLEYCKRYSGHSFAASLNVGLCKCRGRGRYNQVRSIRSKREGGEGNVEMSGEARNSFINT